MQTKASRNRAAASNSFNREECAGIVELFRVVRRGGDARTIANAASLVRLERKFAAMLASIDAHREVP